jgi:hypothetical protein
MGESNRTVLIATSSRRFLWEAKDIRRTRPMEQNPELDGERRSIARWEQTSLFDLNRCSGEIGNMNDR